MPLCELSALTIRVPGASDALIDGIDLTIESGEKIAVVGESGAGKSMTARAIAGILPDHAHVEGGVRLGGIDVTDLLGSWTPEAVAHRAAVSMIFQDPRSHLDPRQRIGDFLLEGVRGREQRRHAIMAASEALASVRIADPHRCLRAFPHQLSGGTLQRVMIAAALASRPQLIIADEATTGLDMTSQAQVVDLLGSAVDDRGASLLLVTHDLDLAAQLCDRAIVMRSGRIVDEFRFSTARSDDLAPYTLDLLAARPSEAPAPGVSDAAPLVQVTGLRRTYRRRGGEAVVAVEDSSFVIRPGSCLGLVGESGSGKSTTARMLVGQERADQGRIVVDGRDVTVPPRGSRGRRRRARVVQLVQQDPRLSLDPRQTAGGAIMEVLRLHEAGGEQERRARLVELSTAVGLTAEMLERAPDQLSGGQCQRVAIARALATDPEVVVLDESVSALDVSVQAQVLALLQRLRVERGTTMLFVTHDLGVVRSLAEEVVVMCAGRIVERGATDQVLTAPEHEYTRQLVAAAPPRFRLVDERMPTAGESGASEVES